MFQFHNGSIKSDMSGYEITEEHRFQFHNGSIKSKLYVHLYCEDVMEFQFHNGSIKSKLYVHLYCAGL